MKRIEIITWYKCNCRCKFCFVSPSLMEDSMDTDEIKRVLKGGRGEGATGVHFGGGEPTIRRDILDLISFARGIGYQEIALISNGLLYYYPQFNNMCIEKGANKFIISVWGHKPEIHDELSQVPGSLEKVTVGIENLLELGADIEMNILITTLSFRHLVNIIRYYSEFGIKKFWLWFMSLFGMEEEDLSYLVPKISDVVPHLVESYNTGMRLGVEWIRSTHFPPCFLRECPDMFFNTRDFDMTIVTRRNSFRCEDSPFEGGVKLLPECNNCLEYDECLGMREDYLKLYGSKEIKPFY